MSDSSRPSLEILRSWLAREGPRIGVERPPAELRATLVALFDRRSAASPLLHEPLDEVGELSFDSRRDLALAGTRGPSSASGVYRLAFTSEVADVVLHIEPRSNDAVAVRGQVLARAPRTAASIIVTVVDRASTPITVHGDGLGRFVVADMPRTARALSFQNETMRLVVRLPPDGGDR